MCATLWRTLGADILIKIFVFVYCTWQRKSLNDPSEFYSQGCQCQWLAISIIKMFDWCNEMSLIPLKSENWKVFTIYLLLIFKNIDGQTSPTFKNSSDVEDWLVFSSGWFFRLIFGLNFCDVVDFTNFSRGQFHKLHIGEVNFINFGEVTFMNTLGLIS